MFACHAAAKIESVVEGYDDEPGITRLSKMLLVNVSSHVSNDTFLPSIEVVKA